MRAMGTDQAFHRRMRLSLKADFDRVFEEGCSAADGNLVVHVLPTDLGYSRLGMAVGRKHGGAVVRNRIKRLVREAFRVMQSKLSGFFDIVVVPRVGLSAELENIGSSLTRLCEQAAKGRR
jgi:ribonuclease P protein component